MRILKVEPGKAPYVKDMKDGLEAIQQEVQGLFQPVYVEDGVILCCNEEGKLNGMKPNRWLEDDIICGPFFLVGDDHEGGFCSLTDEQLIASITSNFPVGAAMFLEYGNADIRFKYRVIEGSPADRVVPAELILDGQQRITSMYSSLYSPKPVHTKTDKGKEIQRFY